MARLTNEHLHSEIKLVNKELCHVRDNQAKMAKDLAMIKKTVLNPDYGTIARVNKNTEFRKGAQKTLWSIWVVLIGILGKILFWD